MRYKQNIKGTRHRLRHASLGKEGFFSCNDTDKKVSVRPEVAGGSHALLGTLLFPLPGAALGAAANKVTSPQEDSPAAFPQALSTLQPSQLPTACAVHLWLPTGDAPGATVLPPPLPQWDHLPHAPAQLPGPRHTPGGQAAQWPSSLTAPSPALSLHERAAGRLGRQALLGATRCRDFLSISAPTTR